MKKRLHALFLLFFLAGPSLAQEVEFIMPTTIEIIPGQLSVVFEEGIAEQEAKDIITTLGYEILESTFLPLLLTTTLDEPIPDDVRQALEAEEGITATQFYATQAPIFSAKSETTTRSTPEYRLTVTFEETITQKEAETMLSRHVLLKNLSVEALPDEIIINVGDQDEEAITSLEQRKEVRWVTYIGSGSNQ